MTGVRTRVRARVAANRVAMMIMAASAVIALATAGPAFGQDGQPAPDGQTGTTLPPGPTGPIVAAAFDPDPAAGPVQSLAYDQNQLYTELTFTDPARLRTDELDVAIVHGTEAGDTGRVFTTVRAGTLVARDQANTGDGWSTGTTLSVSITPEGRLRIERPAPKPAPSRSESIYVTVDFLAPAQPAWHSFPVPVSDLDDGTKVDLPLWSWAGPAIADGRLLSPAGTTLSIQPQRGYVVIDRSEAPKEVVALGVESMDDVLYLRPNGVNDGVAPLELRFDADEKLTVFRRGESAPLRAPDGMPSPDGIYRVSPTGGFSGREYKLPIADLEAVIGQPLERTSLIDGSRTFNLAGGRSIRLNSAAIGIDLGALPTGPDAVAATPTVPPAPSNRPPTLLIAGFALVIGGLVLYGAVTFVRQTMWWEMRRQAREER